MPSPYCFFTADDPQTICSCVETAAARQLIP